MISHRYKFIFIHINKTGGTSIEKFFDPFADQRDVERKHAKVRFYKRNYPNKFREYFKFAFVRNPWDWLVSRYHWSKEHQDLFDFSFAEFIRRLDHGIPLSDQAEWLENIALRPQIDRLTVDGQIAVDFIGRFENLQGDFNEICARLGIRAGILENVFKTAHRRYTEYYDDEQRSIVERLYAADIAAFDYRYDDRRNELPPIGAIVQRGIDVNIDVATGDDTPAGGEGRQQRLVELGDFDFVPLAGSDLASQAIAHAAPHVFERPPPSPFHVERLAGNPIIRLGALPGKDGFNINGPSLIRVPAWIDNPLGRYYLYFAHHRGRYIRLAYADDLSGPWTIYQPGALAVEHTLCDAIDNPVAAREKHIASPDVHVDDAAREIRMYFHGTAYKSGPRTAAESYAQQSLVATSRDGLHFEARDECLGPAYFRAFHWRGAWYALAMPGIFYRSPDGLHGFIEGPTLFANTMRHSAVKVDGTTLQVFYSLIGDNPERILLSTIELGDDWTNWRASAPQLVVEPEMDWEGAKLNARASAGGKARGPSRQLRDPAIFVDESKTYLLYTVAGEAGIAIARLSVPPARTPG